MRKHQLVQIQGLQKSFDFNRCINKFVTYEFKLDNGLSESIAEKIKQSKNNYTFKVPFIFDFNRSVNITLKSNHLLEIKLEIRESDSQRKLKLLGRIFFFSFIAKYFEKEVNNQNNNSNI